MASAIMRRVSTNPEAFITPEEYLEIERKAEYKSEYWNGQMFAMAGGRRNHNLLALNVGAGLYRQLRDRPCEVHPSDMRVRTPSGAYTYPDASVACGSPKFLDATQDNLLNPVLIVEVLSPSTGANDRTKKFDLYRGIESLQEYLMISSDRVHAPRRPT